MSEGQDSDDSMDPIQRQLNEKLENIKIIKSKSEISKTAPERNPIEELYCFSSDQLLKFLKEEKDDERKVQIFDAYRGKKYLEEREKGMEITYDKYVEHEKKKVEDSIFGCVQRNLDHEPLVRNVKKQVDIGKQARTAEEL